MSSTTSETINSSLKKPFRETWLGRNAVRILILVSVIFAGLTIYAINSSDGPLGQDLSSILWLVLIDLSLLLALSGLITMRMSSLFIARKRKAVGSRLQTRIILMFTLVAAIPSILISLFSILFFNQGIQSWFDDRVSTALNESVAVAESYLGEHKDNIRADIIAMASDLNKEAIVLVRNKKRFQNVVNTQGAIRALREVVVFHGETREDALTTDLTQELQEEVSAIPKEHLTLASQGKVVVFLNDSGDRMRALYKLKHPAYEDLYLLVGRFIEESVLEHMRLTQSSVDEYQRLKNGISEVQIQFSMIFVAVAFLILLASVWAGMNFTGELVEPISELIKATERVKAGDMDVRVSEGPLNDEAATLGRAFNRMTDQLQKQRAELVEVNRQTDARRRLNEAVLAGVTAGVVALDRNRIITLTNPRAPKLLSSQLEDIAGLSFEEVFPEIEVLLTQADSLKGTIVQEEVTIERDSRKFTFLVRIVTEVLHDETEGYVVTFDDITPLVNAQRTAAWSDVARRIAHEIKNPLTPIHLSLDRLSSKYRSQVPEEETESFDKYLNTIDRHVSNIGRIVDEFVQFARLPQPKLKKQDIGQLIRESVMSQGLINENINIMNHLPKQPLFIHADSGLISQILTNIIKNAQESVESRLEDQPAPEGRIHISMDIEEKSVIIRVKDNGLGFPEELVERITEPYVTTRENGTGLGLAIVKKVISDHDGSLIIENNNVQDPNEMGATVSMVLPRVDEKEA